MIDAPELQKGGSGACAVFEAGQDGATVRAAKNPAQQRRGLGSGIRRANYQPDSENQSHHHPGSPLRHKQEERSRPNYGPGMAIRRNPDAGQVIETGFYRTDPVTGSL